MDPAAVGQEFRKAVVSEGRGAVLRLLTEARLANRNLAGSCSKVDAARQYMMKELPQRVVAAIARLLSLGGVTQPSKDARRRLRQLFSRATKGPSPLCACLKMLTRVAQYHRQLAVLEPPAEEEGMSQQLTSDLDLLASWNADAVSQIALEVHVWSLRLWQHARTVEGICLLACTFDAVAMARVADMLCMALSDTVHDPHLKKMLQQPKFISYDLLNRLHLTKLACAGARVLLSVKRLLPAEMISLLTQLSRSNNAAKVLLPLLNDADNHPLPPVNVVCNLLHSLLVAAVGDAQADVGRTFFYWMHSMPFGQSPQVANDVAACVSQLGLTRQMLALCCLLEVPDGPAADAMRGQQKRRIQVAALFEKTWGDQLRPEGEDSIVAAIVQVLEQQYGSELEHMRQHKAAEMKAPSTLELRVTAMEQQVVQLRAEQHMFQRSFMAKLTTARGGQLSQDEEEALAAMQRAAEPSGGALQGASQTLQGGSRRPAQSGQLTSRCIGDTDSPQRQTMPEREAKQRAACHLQDMLDNRESRRVAWELGGQRGEIDRFAFSSTMPETVLRQRLESLRA